MRTLRRCTILFAMMALVGALLPLAAVADPVSPMQRTWMRTDQPVASGVSARTWMWGPQESAYATEERYQDTPGGEREVIYYDKARMEVTRPDADSASPWHVTNGLLVVEMIEGRLQLGDTAFDDAPEPANVPIVGDLDGGGLTYADIAVFGLRSEPARNVGDAISAYVADDGTILADSRYQEYGVTAAHVVDVPGIQHSVASVFWTFMHSSGIVFENGQYTDAGLFQDPFYATGYPITEAYWSTTAVGGADRDVLWQCFERRCLTYTPDNAEEWQIEAGNVGLHYYQWRYGEARPAAPTLSVMFNIIVAGELVARTVTNETFLGDTAVGTWTTIAPDGSQRSNGTLVADHPLGLVEASIVQSWPYQGTATMQFTYNLGLTGVSGDGTLTWRAELSTGTETGTTPFTARSTTLDVWDITLDELPPVLFTSVE